MLRIVDWFNWEIYLIVLYIIGILIMSYLTAVLFFYFRIWRELKCSSCVEKFIFWIGYYISGMFYIPIMHLLLAIFYSLHNSPCNFNEEKYGYFYAYFIHSVFSIVVSFAFMGFSLLFNYFVYDSRIYSSSIGARYNNICIY